jgi:aminomethyltransferase
VESVHTDIETDYRSLRENAGLIDYAGIGLFRVTGPGSGGFLNRACARSVDFLLEGQVLPTLTLDEAGTVVAELLMHCEGDRYLIEVWPAQRDAARSHLELRTADAADVTFQDESDAFRVFGVEGPHSFRVVQRFLSFPIASMAYNSFTTETWEDLPLIISRTGVTGEYGYKLIAPREGGERLRQALIDAGASPVGSEALDVCRMEMRFVNLEGEGGGESVTPFDLGLQWMADLEHDFHGKSALEGQAEGRERRPVCWVGDGATSPPARGTVLASADGAVGEVTHAVYSPGLGHVIGTAWITEELAASGLELRQADDGRTVRTISAPFRVPTSFQVSLD